VVSGLLLLELGHFLGWRGVARMFCHGVGLAVLVTGVSYVMLKWYEVVIRNQAFGNSGDNFGTRPGGGSSGIVPGGSVQEMSEKLLRGFFIFNICFHLFFWPPWIASGLYEDHDVWLNNVLVGTAMTWAGVCGLAMTICIVYLATKLINLLEETNLVTGSRRITKIIKKVLIL